MFESKESASTLFTDSEPFVCEWLENLIRAGELKGEVLQRDIRELAADDVSKYERVHFFAGIGGWELALELAGWRGPVWTGSCPCQPFSVAGRGRGEEDERHLWPVWRGLIAECRPPVVFGEQVASPAGRKWLAAVCDDLEALGYCTAAADLCAASVGAPHIRQRLYWGAVRLGNASGPRAWRDAGGLSRAQTESGGERLQARHQRHLSGDASADVRLGDTDIAGSQGWGERGDRAGQRATRQTSVADWRACEWIECSDGKARPIESGTLPLADGVPARVGRICAYGNAIVPQLASEFVSAFYEAAMSLCFSQGLAAPFGGSDA